MLIQRVTLGLLVATTFAQAQDLRYGVQAHLNLPSGDLKEVVDDKPGLGLGVHMTLDFGQGHVLRPRLDYLTFPEATVFSAKNNVNCLSLGADYLYLFEGTTGFYVTGGLSANRWKVDIDTTGFASASDTTTKLGYALGAGFAFNPNLSLEGRFTSTKFDSGAISDQNANAFQVAALYRF